MFVNVGCCMVGLAIWWTYLREWMSEREWKNLESVQICFISVCIVCRHISCIHVCTCICVFDLLSFLQNWAFTLILFFLSSLFLSVTSRRRPSGCSRSQTGFDQEESGLTHTHIHIENAFMSLYKAVWWANGSTTGSVTVKQGLWFPFEQLNVSACVKDRNHSYSTGKKMIIILISIDSLYLSIQSISEGQNTFLVKKKSNVLRTNSHWLLYPFKFG